MRFAFCRAEAKALLDSSYKVWRTYLFPLFIPHAIFFCVPKFFTNLLTGESTVYIKFDSRDHLGRLQEEIITMGM